MVRLGRRWAPVSFECFAKFLLNRKRAPPSLGLHFALWQPCSALRESRPPSEQIASPIAECRQCGSRFSFCIISLASVIEVIFRDH